ncbi:hypothetical protein DNFV4_03983 [Nitrospira tepida]|uniref:TIGR04255 family protein n=1 Tax=Nitrospira tepida TaxID=2973512 RepID=A0AA86T8H4_9BACT|nr:TIGR04255 family protein [Nitrospira tepida]CAI4033542.1 hypothetical protein DNFV4_03983 [Nitrospira tepida]
MQPYPNPPIKEALVDIRVDPLPSSTLPTLEALHDQIREHYPTKKARHRWEGSVEIQEDRLISAAQRHLGRDGFLFYSQDEQQIVQYRLDGFTFNRLRPYPSQGWPVIRTEAKGLWELYLRTAQPQRIVRIGLRYINQINIPGQQVKLEDYLTEPPRVPAALPQTLEYFLTRLVIPLPALEAKAIITQSLVPVAAPDTTSLILDIDVLTEAPRPPDTASIWDVLERFREFKNTIFKSSLTPRTEELFR